MDEAKRLVEDRVAEEVEEGKEENSPNRSRSSRIAWTPTSRRGEEGEERQEVEERSCERVSEEEAGGPEAIMEEKKEERNFK